jgi:WD40 repeat protein
MPSPARLAVFATLAAVAGLSAQPPAPVTFKGHADPVYAVAVSPDGDVLATGSFDKTIKLWDPTAGKEVRTLGGKTGHTNQVLSLSFSPDGKMLASGGSDNQARVWPLTGKDEPKVLAHPNLVDGVAFDKSSSLLATACHDGILRVWDVVKGTATKTINAHTQPTPAPIYCVAWSPDAKQLATGSFDQSIKVWDATAGTIVKDIRPGRDRLPADPKIGRPAPALIGGAAGSWLNAPPDVGHRDQVFTLAFSADGKYLASGSSDRTVKLWNPKTGELVRDFPNPSLKPGGPGQPHPSHPGFVHCVRFTPDGKRLVTAGTAPRGQGYLAVWSVADGKLVSGHELPVGPIYSFDFVGDGIVLGCGPRSRQTTESDAVLVPLPK